VYAKQILWEAVSSLATSPDSIQKRLASAGVSFAKLSTENDGGLPKNTSMNFNRYCVRFAANQTEEKPVLPRLRVSFPTKNPLNWRSEFLLSM
jgi:hypothetical protein